MSNVFLFLADASYEGAAGLGVGSGLRGIDFSNLGYAELQLMQVRSPVKKCILQPWSLEEG